MTLTELWKKGELEEGWYYINDSQIDYKYSKYSSADFFITPHEDIKEVLVPVPSYEEWKQLHKFLEEFNALDVAKENQQLKELLRECRELFDELNYLNMVEKIDNAIGE